VAISSAWAAGSTSVEGANSTDINALSAAVSASGTSKIDFVYGESPYEYIESNFLSGISPPDIFLVNPTTTLLSKAAGAPRVCPAEQTDRTQLPDELHDYLAQRTAIRCMEARGFTQDMQNHLRKLADLEAAFDRLTAPRATGEFKAIVQDDWYYIGLRP
jgi:hypothetical protein